MSRPLISVIMGTHNPQRSFIYKAVKSVLSQTLSDFEFIICDDGSSEKYSNILSDIVALDDRIKLIRNTKNLGLAATLNRCLEVASGQFIARMDDDDICLPNRFREQVDFLQSNKNYMFVGSCIEYIDDNDNVWGTREVLSFPQKEDFLYNSPYVHPSVMFRREAFANGDIYSTQKIALRTEDYELWMRLYGHGKCGANIQCVLLQYREGRTGYAKRKKIYRLHEMVVRIIGFYEIDILGQGLLYVIKPLLIAIMPISVVRLIKGIRERKNKS